MELIKLFTYHIILVTIPWQHFQTLLISVPGLYVSLKPDLKSPVKLDLRQRRIEGTITSFVQGTCVHTQNNYVYKII